MATPDIRAKSDWLTEVEGAATSILEILSSPSLPCSGTLLELHTSIHGCLEDVQYLTVDEKVLFERQIVLKKIYLAKWHLQRIGKSPAGHLPFTVFLQPSKNELTSSTHLWCGRT